MTDDFRDELSEDDLARLTGGVDEGTALYRAVTRAVWEYFDHFLPLGDAKQTGIIVITELENNHGHAIRFMVGDAEGNPIPTWRIRGLVHELLHEVPSFGRGDQRSTSGPDEH